MKTVRSIHYVAVALFALVLVACGDGDGVGTTGTGTLGVTSVPNPTVVTASLASQLFGKTWRFLSAGSAIADIGPTCPPGEFVHEFTLTGGTIWIEEAYAILDEVGFEDSSSSSSSDGPEFGPFAADLTATDPNVPDSISLVVPSGNYDEIKFKIKRLEDEDVEQPINVSDIDAFRQIVGFSTNNDVRPSIWIKGGISDGTHCHSFRFVTDLRWIVRVPFDTTVDPTQVDVVLLVDLERAFQSAVGVTAANLAAEVGCISDVKSLGGDHLDGRLKDDRYGCTNARAVARAIGPNVQIYIQGQGTFSANPGIDDSARRVDDSPESVEIPG